MAIEEGKLVYGRRDLNYNNFNLLFQKNMAFGLPIIEKKRRVCEGCLLRKHRRQPFLKEGARITKEALKLVHTNMCAYMNTLSHAQNKYFFYSLII